MKFFTISNDNLVAHYTVLNNWTTVKCLGSFLAFSQHGWAEPQIHEQSKSSMSKIHVTCITS